jgi:hypothetical protein
MAFPLIVWWAEPVLIVQPVCPWTGQLHVSPTQATGIPPILKCGALALITLPPCEVASPSRMTFFIDLHPCSISVNNRKATTI